MIDHFLSNCMIDSWQKERRNNLGREIRRNIVFLTRNNYFFSRFFLHGSLIKRYALMWKKEEERERRKKNPSIFISDFRWRRIGLSFSLFYSISMYYWYMHRITKLKTMERWPNHIPRVRECLFLSEWENRFSYFFQWMSFSLEMWEK